LHATTNIHRLRWTSYLTPGDRENATQIRSYPVRFTDIDLFNHMNNSVYWSRHRRRLPPARSARSDQARRLPKLDALLVKGGKRADLSRAVRPDLDGFNAFRSQIRSQI
jgi:hypothetical protein